MKSSNLRGSRTGFVNDVQFNPSGRLISLFQTDASVAKLWSSLDSSGAQEFRLPKLRTLNLRQMPLSDTSLNLFLSMCPNLKRVDLSFTLVRHPPALLSITTLEKLNLTSTAISSSDLIDVLGNLQHLKSLSIGALGGGQATSMATSNATAMTMTDQLLRTITDILQNYNSLERVSLVGNAKLGLSGRHDSSIAYFIRKVGRRCQVSSNSLSGESRLVLSWYDRTSTWHRFLHCGRRIWKGY